jgi:hypothetical protein
MRASIAISAALAFFATTFVSAAPAAKTAVVAAADCNPSYNVPSSTPCFTACNVVSGQEWVPGWTMDHTSPKFIPSLTLMCNKTAPEYRKFMTKAGTCMAQCTSDDPESFNKEFQGACAWWNAHKDAGNCVGA